MAEPNLDQLNDLLRPLSIELAGPERIRILPDDPSVKGPSSFLTLPGGRSEYRLAEFPHVERIVRSLEPLTNTFWRRQFSDRPELRNLQILAKLRDRMQDAGADESGRNSRILSTFLYWKLLRRLPLGRSEARDEAIALAHIAAVHGRQPGTAHYEIARHAVWSMEVLIETRPKEEVSRLRALLPKHRDGRPLP